MVVNLTIDDGQIEALRSGYTIFVDYTYNVSLESGSCVNDVYPLVELSENNILSLEEGVTTHTTASDGNEVKLSYDSSQKYEFVELSLEEVESLEEVSPNDMERLGNGEAATYSQSNDIIGCPESLESNSDVVEITLNDAKRKAIEHGYTVAYYCDEGDYLISADFGSCLTNDDTVLTTHFERVIIPEEQAYTLDMNVERVTSEGGTPVELYTDTSDADEWDFIQIDDFDEYEYILSSSTERRLRNGFAEQWSHRKHVVALEGACENEPPQAVTEIYEAWKKNSDGEVSGHLRDALNELGWQVEMDLDVHIDSTLKEVDET